MKGGVAEYSDQEQALREHVAARRAEFSFKQRLERMRWERDTLAPEVAKIKQDLIDGKAPTLELTDAA